MNRSRRRESALTFIGLKVRGLTSAATRFMGSGTVASLQMAGRKVGRLSRISDQPEIKIMFAYWTVSPVRISPMA